MGLGAMVWLMTMSDGYVDVHMNGDTRRQWISAQQLQNTVMWVRIKARGGGWSD